MASLSSVPVPSLQPDACQLLHLPEELFFRVLQVCTVLSVLTIRQCCKLSCQYTKDRSVWIHQLSSFLAEMKIEPCGVVPDIDRLSPLDLELLVTRHLRTRCRAWRYRSRSLPYASWRASGSEGIQSVLMVRGGRFLLGCSGDTLFFWDIGFQVGRPAERETLVCSTPIDLPAGCTSNSTYIWKFHDIGPLLYVSIWTAGNCKAERISSRLALSHPEGFDPGSLDNEKLTIFRSSPPALGVHYFGPSVTITWDAEPPAYFSIIDAMPNFALVEDQDPNETRPFMTNLSTVTTWELPSPSRFDTQSTHHLPHYKPFRTWEIPTGFPTGISSLVSWDEGRQDVTYFDRLKCDDETVTIIRLCFTPKYFELENRLEPEFQQGPTISLPRSTLGELQENELIKFCTFADGMRVLYWSANETSTEAKLVMHFSSATDEFPAFHVLVGNRQPALTHWLKHSIMVSIGRICVLDEGKVEIWDLC